MLRIVPSSICFMQEIVKTRPSWLIGLILTAAMSLPGQTQLARVTIKETHGAPSIQTPAGLALSQFRLDVKIHLHTFSGDFKPESIKQGSDSAGSYSIATYRLSPTLSPGTPPSQPAPLQATLELRHYRHPEVIVAALDYNGPPPDAKDGVRLEMALDGFARGMALHRLKRWWLAPTFISDPRLLAGDTTLLLWQRMEGSDYNLLVPLAGGGMVGELKVSNFDQFGVSLSSHDPNYAPRHIPLFAYAAGDDPYSLPRNAYSAAFAANHYYGRLRWQ